MAVAAATVRPRALATANPRARCTCVRQLAVTCSASSPSGSSSSSNRRRRPEQPLAVDATTPLAAASQPPPPEDVRGGSPLPLLPDNSHNGVEFSSADAAAAAAEAAAAAGSGAPRRRRGGRASQNVQSSPVVLVARPLPRVLLIHCGGTLGMDASASFQQDVEGHMVLKPGTGGKYHTPGKSEALKPGSMLGNVLTVTPELTSLAQMELRVAFNLDSSNVGPKQWVQLARMLHTHRDQYDAFVIAHGTDTMSFTASALSLMLAGFRKPVVLTGSQLPLALPRSDARQNLLDAVCCATAGFSPPHVHLQEVAICFGGRLMRGNRAQKVNSHAYQAFDSPNYGYLARMGVDICWNTHNLLHVRSVEGVYRPRFELDTRVMRCPIIPGVDPRQVYGDVAGRGVRGIVLEAFGVGNMPDRPGSGWLPWLREQRKKGVLVYLSSQCTIAQLDPHLYKSGTAALKLGVESGHTQMTAECAAVKLMLCLAYKDLPLGMPLAGEL